MLVYCTLAEELPLPLVLLLDFVVTKIELHFNVIVSPLYSLLSTQTRIHQRAQEES